MKASSLSFRTAVSFAVAGMVWGIVMAASHDHSTIPAHAHWNLLGWVSLFLFGIYYRLHPATDTSRLALAQVGIWSLGTVVLAVAVAVAAIHTSHDAAEPLAAVGSLTMVASMFLFAVLVFRPALDRESIGAAAAAAE